jgi:hypothetical protein
MNSTPEKSEYLLLFRGLGWQRDFSPEAVQKIMVEWMAWADRLVAEGRCKALRSLEDTGKVISGKERKVSDGPFAEAKESVAGYFLLEVNDLDEAIEIGQQCPTLACGMTVEVRPMPARCRASELATGPIEAVANYIAGANPVSPAAGSTLLETVS